MMERSTAVALETLAAPPASVADGSQRDAGVGSADGSTGKRFGGALLTLRSPRPSRRCGSRPVRGPCRGITYAATDEVLLPRLAWRPSGLADKRFGILPFRPSQLSFRVMPRSRLSLATTN